MTRVLAALDNSAAAGPVLATARQVAALLEAGVEALHVQTPDDELLPSAAVTAGVDLRVVKGGVVSRIVEAAESPGVVSLVLGSRRTPGGRRPAGSTALEVMTALAKPIVVVPPDAARPDRLTKVLLPIEGTPATSAVPETVIRLARSATLDVVVLHVCEEGDLPLFSDQLQHETVAWAREFLARHFPVPSLGVRLEVRVGRREDEIVAAAREADADLIVLGWRRQLLEGRAQVVRAVLERCPVPLVLFPVVLSDESPPGSPGAGSAGASRRVGSLSPRG